MRATLRETSVKSAASASRARAASTMISAARTNCGRKLSSRGNSLITAPPFAAENNKRLPPDLRLIYMGGPRREFSSKVNSPPVGERRPLETWHDPAMPSFIRRILPGLSACLVASLVATAAPSPPPKPKLAVVISIDGLGWARLESYRPLYTSGLKRLLDEGF